MYTITVNKITINCSNEKELKKKISLYCGGSYDMHKKLYNEALQAKSKTLEEEEKYVKSDELITDLENAKEALVNKKTKNKK